MKPMQSPLIGCSLARVVRVDDAEQTQGVWPPQRGRVHSRRGLVLATRALEAWRACARHLAQPGNEGARTGIETIALNRATAGLSREDYPPQRFSRGGWHSCSCGCSCCCCCGLDVDPGAFLVLAEAVWGQTGVEAAVSWGEAAHSEDRLGPGIKRDYYTRKGN